MNQQDFMTKVLGRAQELMLSEEFNAKVEKKAASFRGKDVGGSGQDLSALEAQAFGASYSVPSKEGVTLINESAQAQETNVSALPKAIQESFRKRPPMSGSVTDTSAIGKIAASLPKQQPVITEQRQYAPQQASSGIDYSLIKTIIDESVRKHLDELKGGRLNESAEPQFRGMRFTSGNKFQFLDSKGNLYEGVLKLVKKAK